MLAISLVAAEENIKGVLDGGEFLIQRSHQLLEQPNQKDVEAKKMQYFTHYHFHIPLTPIKIFFHGNAV